jgi:hypothetical protein
LTNDGNVQCPTPPVNELTIPPSRLRVVVLATPEAA